ncbi:MAG: protein-L-isoaspartate O-methyltransferase family protein [Planctomycetota bacterium]
MVEEHSATSRKIAWGLLFLLILTGVLVVFSRIDTAGGPGMILAGSDEGPENERVSAEPNKAPGRDPNDPNDRRLLRPLHAHRAFAERAKERERMVSWQIEGRAVKDPNVLKAMRIVPRHAFIRPTEQRYAYADTPLPIGLDQTISQPYIVAFMTEALKLNHGSKVLEIGTGSGYQAAICAEIARKVYTIEIVEPLAKNAKKRLKELGYPNVFVRAGDGFFGWKEGTGLSQCVRQSRRRLFRLEGERTVRRHHRHSRGRSRA